jgi:hypothetical protein
MFMASAPLFDDLTPFDSPCSLELACGRGYRSSSELSMGQMPHSDTTLGGRAALKAAVEEGGQLRA